MKTLDNKTYYEMLEVSTDATACDIKRAYHDALAIYNDDALVTYSLFTDEQRADILNSIEIAFETLIDSHKRANYNRKLFSAGKMISLSTFDANGKQIDFISRTLTKSKADSLHTWVQMKSTDAHIKAMVEGVMAKRVISGRDLRRLRRALGIEKSEVYEITRISGSMLKNIETDEFNALPAEVCLKQFIRSYAEILQLDPYAAVTGYMQNMSAKMA